MTTETKPRFRLGLRTLASLGLGALASILFTYFGMDLQFMPKFFEILLAPGFRLAVLVYGGLHGGEPILLGYLVNTLLYSVLSLIVMWIRFRRASASARRVAIS